MGKIDPALMQVLTELIPTKKNWDDLCDFFAIPERERSESWVAGAIIERIKQYMTSYNIRKSLVERDNGAAFKEPEHPEIIDPVVSQNHEQG